MDSLGLEAAILYDMRAFLMEVGRGFAFVGSQKRITVGRTTSSWNPGHTRASVRPRRFTHLFAHSHDDIDDWLASGLSPARVIDYLCAGVCPTEVAAFENAAHGQAAVQMLTALLG